MIRPNEKCVESLEKKTSNSMVLLVKDRLFCHLTNGLRKPNYSSKHGKK